MLVQLKKGRDGPSTLTCVRADGSRTWGREHPFFPIHDLTHYAVESVLGLHDAFFGLIAAGWNIDDFARPGVSARMPFQALLAEHIVGVLDRERALPRPLTADELNEGVSASILPVSNTRFEPMSDAQLAQVRHLRDMLQIRWDALPSGATLEVSFPALSAAA
jgi:hypothetical protein